MSKKDQINLLIDLGQQPISNRFLEKPDDPKKLFPLKLGQSKISGLIKLIDPIPYSELIPRFKWITYTEPEEHINNMVNKIYEILPKTKKINVGGISFKDDSTIKEFNNKNCKTWRLDLKNDLQLESHVGVESIQNALAKNKTNGITKKYGKSDLLIVRHIWEHVYDQLGFSESLKNIITKDGLILFEIPDCSNLLENYDYTMIWEEHLYYYNKETFSNSLKEFGFEIINLETINYPYENIITALVKRSENPIYSIDNNFLENQFKIGNNYKKNFNKTKIKLINYLEKESKKGKIALFGAGHMSCSFLSYFEIDKYISYIIDDHKEKNGKTMPFGKLLINDPSILENGEIHLCLLSMNPIKHKNVIQQHKYFQKKGGKFISIFLNDLKLI